MVLKILELFSGYGGAIFALSKAGIEHKCIGYSDIEKCANYIYALNHGDNIPALGDVTKINPEELEDFDLCTFGFPCQSFSIAGKREGFAAANKGKLFFEVIRILETKKPRYALGENVQGLLSHDGGKTFENVLSELKRIGYYVQWKLLFSKEHGTPQNRPRVWIACFREKEDYNKFMFPEKEHLKITVKDLLEDEVDEKYYLNENQLKKIEEGIKKENFSFYFSPEDLTKPFKTLKAHMGVDKSDVPYFSVTDICTTITSHAHKDNNSVPIFNTAHTKAMGSRFKNDGTTFTLEAMQSQSLCVADFRYDEGVRPRKDGIAPTINARKRNDGDGLPIICDDGTSEKFRTYREDGLSPTLKSSRSNYALKEQNKQWRRLTPRECFRLQGFFNDEVKFGNLKDSKLYFLAGNGWDINTASKIFIQMFIGNKNKQKTIFEF